MPETLLVPGLNGSGQGHWQRYWAEDQPDARLLEQAHFDRPVLEEWLPALEAALLATPGAYLVGHSLGCLLIAALAGRPAAALVRGALLVAPCELGLTDRLHPGCISFGAMPERALPFPTLAVGSRNDPYMPFDTFQQLVSRWGCMSTDLGRAGHINIASGFGRWRGGYDLLSAVGTRAGRASWSGSVAADAAATGEQRQHLSGRSS